MAYDSQGNGHPYPKWAGVGNVMDDLLSLFGGGGIIGIPNQKEPKSDGHKYFKEFF